MIRRILVPLDGSELAESVHPFVRALDGAFSPSVLLLRVVERGSETRNGLGSVDWRLERAEAEAYLELQARKLREAGVEDVVWRIETGDGAAEIVAVAQERHVDLIVLSTHGEGGVTAFPVSGTAQKVVLSAPSSLLLARPAVEPREWWGETPERGGLERIVMAMDGSSRGDWALCLAASLARTAGSELILLTVLAPPESLPGARRRTGVFEDAVQVLGRANRATAESHLRRMARELAAFDLEIRTRIATGESVAQTVDRACTEEAASLLVLAAHRGVEGNEWAFGSVTNSLLFHGTTPLLVFQDDQRFPRKDPPFRSRRRMSGDTRQAWTP